MRSGQSTPLRPHHAPPAKVDFGRSRLSSTPPVPAPTEDIVTTAGHAGRLLSPDVFDALVDFADSSHPSGALLVRNVPVGSIGPTPPAPTAPTTKDAVSELSLLTIARRLGQPVGYEPEHGGELVQNIVPTRHAAGRQTSTSSKVELMFHTEAAFHPHRPRYLLLLCLRGDRAAQTTLCSISEVLPHLDPSIVDILFEPRFRTAVDESYRTASHRPRSTCRCDRRTGERRSMVFDATHRRAPKPKR
jgi:L-asparagine oxygenase